MGFLAKVIVTGLATIVAAYLLPGVMLNSFATALLVAIVLSVLNAILKPVLIILTIPITILTLGLFLLVINAVIVRVADAFISGFAVDGWLTAILFSLIVSIVTYILDSLANRD